METAVGYLTSPRFELVDAARRPVRVRPTVYRAAAALARAHGDVVPADRLIGEIWAQRTPRHPEAALQTTISRLRGVLAVGRVELAPVGPDEPAGYRLIGLPGPAYIPLPFTGRDGDLHRIGRLLDSYDGALVTGAPGIGRSRMLAEFAAVRSGDVVTLDSPDPVLLGDVADKLRKAAGHATIVVDDIDHAGDAVVELLLALTDVGAAKVVASARDTAYAGGQPATLLASGQWARHELGPLDAAAVAALATATGLDPAGAAPAAGNPELLNALLRDPASAAGTVADVVARRLSGYRDAVLEALSAIAVAGHLDWPSAEAMIDSGDLSDLARSGLVIQEPVGLRVASAVVADAVNQRVAGPERRRILRALIAAGEAPAERARWSLELGETGPAADHHLAAVALLQAGDPDDAERHAAVAFEAQPDPAHAATWMQTLLFGSRTSVEIAQRLSTLATRSGDAAKGEEPPPEPFLATLKFLKDADTTAAAALLAAAPDHPMTDVARVLIDAYRGRPDPARALRSAAATPDPVSRAAAWSTWFLTAGLTEDDDTDEVLWTLTEHGSGLSQAQLSAFRARRLVVRGELAAARTELDRAREATALADLRQRSLLHVVASELAFAAGDAGQAARDAGRAAAILQQTGHRSDERVARQWQALMNVCAGRDDGAREALGRAVALPAAAVIGEHHEAAARALLSGAQPGAAIEVGRQAAETTGVHADALWPQVERALRFSPGDLTPREREIARLVAARRTSREIADQLGLSARTVQNHTANAYRKLGIHRRTELPTDL